MAADSASHGDARHEGKESGGGCAGGESSETEFLENFEAFFIFRDKSFLRFPSQKLHSIMAQREGEAVGGDEADLGGFVAITKEEPRSPQVRSAATAVVVHHGSASS